MGVYLRSATASDEPFLSEMTYLSLYVAVGAKPFPRSILGDPQIAHYFAGFGARAGDVGVIAVDSDDAVGAAWCRCHPADDPSYGWVAEDIPELSIALDERYRNAGVGSQMLSALIEQLHLTGVGALSLSVDATSPAVRLYKRFGFREHERSPDGASLTMVLELR